MSINLNTLLQQPECKQLAIELGLKMAAAEIAKFNKREYKKAPITKEQEISILEKIQSFSTENQATFNFRACVPNNLRVCYKAIEETNQRITAYFARIFSMLYLIVNYEKTMQKDKLMPLIIGKSRHDAYKKEAQESGERKLSTSDLVMFVLECVITKSRDELLHNAPLLLSELDRLKATDVNAYKKSFIYKLCTPLAKLNLKSFDKELKGYQAALSYFDVPPIEGKNLDDVKKGFYVYHNSNKPINIEDQELKTIHLLQAIINEHKCGNRLAYTFFRNDFHDLYAAILSYIDEKIPGTSIDMPNEPIISINKLKTLSFIGAENLSLIKDTNIYNLLNWLNPSINTSSLCNRAQHNVIVISDDEYKAYEQGINAINLINQNYKKLAYQENISEILSTMYRTLSKEYRFANWYNFYLKEIENRTCIKGLYKTFMYDMSILNSFIHFNNVYILYTCAQLQDIETDNKERLNFIKERFKLIDIKDLTISATDAAKIKKEIASIKDLYQEAIFTNNLENIIKRSLK